MIRPSSRDGRGRSKNRLQVGRYERRNVEGSRLCSRYTGKNSTEVQCVSITFWVSFERGSKALNGRELDKLGLRVGKQEPVIERFGRSKLSELNDQGEVKSPTLKNRGLGTQSRFRG